MRYVHAICLAFLCAALLAGCGRKPEPPADADPVIATVDGREIRASTFLAEYETVPADRRAHYAAHRNELLDFIINRMVIAAEARAQGLDEDPEVLERLERTRRFALRLALERDLTKDLPPIAESELRARYRADVLDPAGPKIVKQTIVYRIPADDASKAAVHEKILESREAHLPFGTVATRSKIKFSIVADPPSLAPGITLALAKELAALKTFTATRLTSIEDEGFIFYREPLPFEQAARIVRRALRAEQRAKAVNAWVGTTRRESQRSSLREDHVIAYPERLTSDAADVVVVAVVKGKAITAADARRALELMPAPAQARYRANPASLLDYLVGNRLLVWEADRRGLDKTREFVSRMQQATEAVLIRTMRERVLAKFEITISDEELRALAAQSTGGDLPREFIQLSYIANADRAKVEQALDELKAGKAFDEVHKACSADTRQDLGTWSDTTLERMPEALRTATKGVKDGGLTSVLEMDERFLVVRVTRRPAIVDLGPWRAQLLAKKEAALFLGWATEQRANHRIVLNTKRLGEVQLPEAPSPPSAPLDFRTPSS